MFLRCKVRRKDGKQHRYWSVVENTRVAGGRVVQRHVLYLGEINDTQELAWRRSIKVLRMAPRGRGRGHCRCFRKTASRGCWRMTRSSASDCRNCVCAGRGSGVLAGADAGRELQLDPVLVEAAGSEPQRACPRESGGTMPAAMLVYLGFFPAAG
jgi:hypothetical protein